MSEEQPFGRRAADAQSIGEVIGEMRQIGQRMGSLETSFDRFRETSSQEHAAVVQQLTGMAERFHEALEKKADKAEVEAIAAKKDVKHAEQDAAIAELKAEQNRQAGARGPSRLAQWVIGSLGAILVALLSVLFTLLATGHP